MSDPDHWARLRHAYDVVAEDYAASVEGLSAETALDVAMIDDFADRCVASRLGRVADVGCGPGRVSAYLAARGVDVFGVDLSPGMVDVARRTHPHLRFEVGALHELGVPDAALGGLLAWYSLIHTAPGELSRAVGEFARVVRPGGWFLTAFQAGRGERVDRDTAYGHAVPMTNYRHDPRQVVAVLGDGGFDVRAEVHRSPEDHEKTPQSIMLARRGR